MGFVCVGYAEQVVDAFESFLSIPDLALTGSGAANGIPSPLFELLRRPYIEGLRLKYGRSGFVFKIPVHVRRRQLSYTGRNPLQSSPDKFPYKLLHIQDRDQKYRVIKMALKYSYVLTTPGMRAPAYIPLTHA